MRGLLLAAVMITAAIPARAQGSPWETAVDQLKVTFTGPIARGLSLVAIVIGGLMLAFDESGGAKRVLAGIIFGVGMALGAVSFMNWLFP
jgi:type IV secretory pathway VirB2 component (pilin)